MFRISLASLLFCQFMVTPSQARAGSFGQLADAERRIVSALAQKATATTPAGLMLKMESTAGAESYTLLASTPKERLKGFFVNELLPKALGPAVSVGKLSAKTLMKFPLEAFSFFVAVGAINMSQLIFNYGDNPTILQQHIESQKDPVGQLGFAAFMLSNAYVTTPLMAMMKPGSKALPFIPYLGMSVGMVASNIVHEVMHIKEIEKCVASLQTRVAQKTNYESCQRAYDNWTEYRLEKMHEWAPGLVSMLASTFVSGMLQSYLTKKVLVALGVEALLLATPTGAGGNVLRWSLKGLGHVAQIGLFVGLDQLMHNWFATPYKNIREGHALTEQESRLLAQLLDKKENGWKPSAKGNDYDLDLNIRKTTQLMKQWREMNMEDISAAHASWSLFLNQFTATYKSANDFYQDFLGQVHTKTFNDRPGWPLMMSRTFPLNGITPKEPEIKGAELDLFASPDEYVRHQKMTVLEVAKNFRSQENQGLYIKVSATPTETRQFKGILELMESGDDTKIGQAMDKINNLLTIKIDYPGLKANPRTPPLNAMISGDLKSGRQVDTSKGLGKLLVTLRSSLGTPAPLWQPGLGYLVAYQSEAQSAPLLKEVQAPARKARLEFFSPLQYFVGFMALGPDAEKGESLISMKSGFAAQFMPPKIVRTEDFQLGLPLQSGLSDRLATITNVPVVAKLGGKAYTFNNTLDITRQGYVRASVLGTKEKSEVANWWTKYVESQYISAWADYEAKYQKNVVKLAKRLWSTDDQSFNIGPVANGIGEALNQERKLYLLILGELFKDLYRTQYQEIAPLADNSAAAVNIRGLNLKKSAKEDQTLEIPLLKTLRLNTSLDLSSLLLAFDQPRANRIAKAQPASARNLKIQEIVSQSFAKLEALLQQFKVTQVKGEPVQINTDSGLLQIETTSEVVASEVKNKDLESALKEINETLEALRSEFTTAQERKQDALLMADDFQIKVIEACIDGLKANAHELKTYGSIANAVSYRRSEGASEDTSRRTTECLNKGIGQRLTESGLKLVMERCRHKD